MWRKVTSYFPEKLRPAEHTAINVIGIVRLQGVIAASSSRPIPAAAGTRISLSSTEETLRKAFDLPGLKALALVINSPGGSPAQSSLIYQRIRQLRDRAEKERSRDFPIFGFVEDVAASGGYYLACAADEIYADPNSMVGSVGVVSQSFGLQNVAQRLHLERRLFTAGKYKVRNDPFSSMTSGDVEKIQSMMAQTHENFKSVVRASRGDRLKGSDEELFQGDVYLAGEAQRLGLIDGVGEVESTCRAKYGDDLRFLLVHPPRKGLFESLAGGPFGAATMDTAYSAVAGGGAPLAAAAAGSGISGQQLGYELIDGALARLEEEQIWAASGAQNIRW